MNILKNWLTPKSAVPPTSKPEAETEEVPTMILEGEQFYTYRRFRSTNSSVHHVATPVVPLIPTR